jgi:hypothetical protein
VPSWRLSGLNLWSGDIHGEEKGVLRLGILRHSEGVVERFHRVSQSGRQFAKGLCRSDGKDDGSRDRE